MIKIKVENIKKFFPGKNGTNGAYGGVEAIGGINLEVNDGEFLAIVGTSGCGKSTFLEILAGLIKPTSGSIFIDGKAINGPDHDRGIVFQGYALFPWRNVLANIAYGLEEKGVPRKTRDDICAKFVTLVGLQGFEDHYPYQLSGGMKQRVAIARALAYDPDILLMDEPFGALDAQTREILQRELLHIWEETHKTILFITHSIDEAVFLSDRVAIMTARPGVIKKEMNVPLSRSARFEDDIRTSQDFVKTRYELWGHLKEEVVKAQQISGNSTPAI